MNHLQGPKNSLISRFETVFAFQNGESRALWDQKPTEMKTSLFTILLTMMMGVSLFAQANLVKVKQRTFKTSKGITIEGESGFLEVPENRKNPASRSIQFKYVWLKSLSDDPKAPIVFLEGGDGAGTWQAFDPGELSYWLELLEVGDLIFVDRRGAEDRDLVYKWKGDFPEQFFVTEEAAALHYQQMLAASQEVFAKRGVDPSAYDIESSAHDVNDLMTELGIDKYALYGFSFGSHVGMAAMQLFPDRISRAIFTGADAPHQSFNYPRYFDEHIEKIAELAAADSQLSQTVPDFKALVHRVMDQLEESPATVRVRHPFKLRKMDVKVGAFGLGLILRLDIDDFNDIPAIPRLLYRIEQGDYSMLTWFVQKRMIYSLATSGNGINQQLASGASIERWAQIMREAKESRFGNTVNFPFSAAKDHWPTTRLSFDPDIPIQTDIPTLFITGTLDCRTPVAQVEETIQGFEQAIHIQVKNAGHEQARWAAKVTDIAVPAFLRGETVDIRQAFYGHVRFLPVAGEADGHPSIR